MKRREWLRYAGAAGVGLSAGAVELAGQTAANGREYYQLRKYHLMSGGAGKLVDTYFAEALIPALTRMGFSPIGAFNLYLGPETPSLYLLIPSKGVEKLVTADLLLGRDEEYQKAGAPFLAAAAREPVFDRIESTLSQAFEGFPKLALTPASKDRGARVFQLRTYESPSQRDHVRKVQMFNHGEFAIFEKAGFWNVFFGDNLIGPRLPSLTYMVSMPDLAQLEDKWKAFGSNPDWKKLSAQQEYSFEPIVSNITNLILKPTSYSQI